MIYHCDYRSYVIAIVLVTEHENAPIPTAIAVGYRVRLLPQPARVPTVGSNGIVTFASALAAVPQPGPLSPGKWLPRIVGGPTGRQFLLAFATTSEHD